MVVDGQREVYTSTPPSPASCTHARACTALWSSGVASHIVCCAMFVAHCLLRNVFRPALRHTDRVLGLMVKVGGAHRSLVHDCLDSGSIGGDVGASFNALRAD